MVRLIRDLVTPHVGHRNNFLSPASSTKMEAQLHGRSGKISILTCAMLRASNYLLTSEFYQDSVR